MDPWKDQIKGSQTRAVASGGVVTDRKISDVKGKNLNMSVTTVSDAGSGPTGTAGGDVGQADCSARDGGVICTDTISGVNIDGDIDFSVTVKQSNVSAGRVEETLPSSQGPAVEIVINHKVELVKYLRTDHSYILQHVHAKHIVTDRQYQNLKHISQPEKSVTELIDQVIVRGQESCSLFLEVLKEPDILQTYPQLKLLTNIFLLV